jgi:signal transduction histidine kinase
MAPHRRTRARLRPYGGAEDGTYGPRRIAALREVGKQYSRSYGGDGPYGPRRLSSLYEISKQLSRSYGTPERTVLTILATVTKELHLLCAILTEKMEGQPKTIVWRASDMDPSRLQTAEARALKTFQMLTQSQALPVRTIGENAAVSAFTREGRTAFKAKRGRFIDCPLSIEGKPIFGALHLEGADPFDESDVAFAVAIANQLAVALDRNQARLNEVALRQQAESLNQFKTNLVSVVSHEFGNSLTVMKIAASLLEQKLPLKLLKDSDRLFDMILTNIDLLNRAVQNLLNMSRLEAGKLAIDFKETDAAKILRSAAKSLELLCEQKSLRVSLDLPGNLQPVYADEVSLALVISNLLSNAIKYTPAKGRITLGMLPEESRPGYYRVYVQDTGIGVSEEDRAKILGGHFRSEIGKRMTAKGFGVGLSLAQQIVEAHGGTIEIEGSPGKGSRFSFLLPIETQEIAI